jgi:hypothetical protein
VTNRQAAAMPDQKKKKAKNIFFLAQSSWTLQLDERTPRSSVEDHPFDSGTLHWLPSTNRPLIA